MDDPFCLQGGLEDRGPFPLEEGELIHAAMPPNLPAEYYGRELALFTIRPPSRQVFIGQLKHVGQVALP